MAFADGPEMADQLTLARISLYPVLVDIAEEGKRQGSIRADVDSGRNVAWALLGHAWIEDIAFLLGGEQVLVEGALARNLKRVLDSFRPDQPAIDEG